jgi:hypothetical protein
MVTKRLVTHLTKTRSDAEAVVQRVLDAGYVRGEISLIMSDEARLRQFAIGGRTQGATAAGAVIAAIAAVGTTIMLPWIRLIVAGPIAATLAGPGAGGPRGGLIGVLIGGGIPERRAELYETGLYKGEILVVVHARSNADADRFEWLFDDFGPEYVRIGNTGECPAGSFGWRPIRL